MYFNNVTLIQINNCASNYNNATEGGSLYVLGKCEGYITAK